MIISKYQHKLIKGQAKNAESLLGLPSVDASDRRGNNFQLIFPAFSISNAASFPISLFSPGKNAKMHTAGDSVKHLFHSNIAWESLYSAIEVVNSIVLLVQRYNDAL